MQSNQPGQGHSALPLSSGVPGVPAGPERSAKWYVDPLGMTAWRWWDGRAWTHHVSSNAKKKPKLKGWLSWPIVLGFLFVVPLAINAGLQTPLAIPLGFLPVLMVGPVLWWLDRIEPEPFQDRLHAFLWGATIAGAVSLVANTIVQLAASEAWSAVVAAPISEEIMKALGIVWALRRKEIDGLMDGVVYAGWVALGFAVVENFLYFSLADADGLLLQTVIGRGIVTPFLHPLFTLWSGLAIGWAVSRRTSVAGQLAWGLPAAIAAHAAWNGSLTIAQDDQIVLWAAIPAFILLFALSAFALYKARRREQAAFIAQVPTLSQSYGLATEEVAVFDDWKTMLAARKKLARKQRRAFDEVHGNLARLAALHARPGDLDTEAEAVLVSRLQGARARSSAT